jgi:hypothetical protein
MISNVSTTVATFSRPMSIVKPTAAGGRQSQAPLAGLDHSTRKQLVERMEANGDDRVTWQWKPRKLVSAPFSRLRSRRVRRHPVAVAARLAARLALAAARSAASRAAASATKAALKHGLIAAPRQVNLNAIKWGPQVAGRAGVNQVTRTIGRAARRGARRAGATSGRVVGTAGHRSRQTLTRAAMGSDQYGVEVVRWPSLERPEDTQDGHPPAGPRSTMMGHLLWAVKITGFMIKWAPTCPRWQRACGCSTEW